MFFKIFLYFKGLWQGPLLVVLLPYSRLYSAVTPGGAQGSIFDAGYQTYVSYVKDKCLTLLFYLSGPDFSQNFGGCLCPTQWCSGHALGFELRDHLYGSQKLCGVLELNLGQLHAWQVPTSLVPFKKFKSAEFSLSQFYWGIIDNKILYIIIMFDMCTVWNYFYSEVYLHITIIYHIPLSYTFYAYMYSKRA